MPTTWITDLASGRGYLVERIVRELPWLVVATDFSPRVLRRDRQWLRHVGLDERVSLMAFDARRTPFKSKSVQWMTTNLGLPNMREPEGLLRELRRVVSGAFLAISHFYPEDDRVNAAAIHQAGLDTFSFRCSALDAFKTAGWPVLVQNVCIGRAKPTPAGVILEGAR